MLPFN
jgi:1-phosphatidylinositol-4-phosphate 5-kinase